MRRAPLLFPLLLGALGCGQAQTPVLVSLTRVPAETQYLTIQVTPMNGMSPPRTPLTFSRGEFPRGLAAEPLLIGLELPAEAAGSFGMRIEALARPPATMGMSEFLAEVCLPFTLVGGQLKRLSAALVVGRSCPTMPGAQ